MQIKHVCQSCGEVLAVHEHSSYQEIKDCLAGMRALCDACNSWPGCPAPSSETRTQAGERGTNTPASTPKRAARAWI
jgi:hypothetical protein